MFREYDAARDREATHRIWKETGWLEDGKEEIMDRFVGAGRAWVAELNGEAECLVLTASGEVRHLETDLPLCAVSGVTTSRVARKQGLAGRLAARAIAADVANGALVAGLGMFEQGFYNKLGFGSGGYEHMVSFDPATLTIKNKPRSPRRLSKHNQELLHPARLRRRRVHGGVNLFPTEMTLGEIEWGTNAFGLGYFDGPNDELSHCLWFSGKGGENGPYRVDWMVYQTGEQFLELMAVLRNLGDQVHHVRMTEPPGIQLQDLIDLPLRQRSITAKSENPTGIRSIAYWQMRMCDIPGCLAKTHLESGPIRFQLYLTDPIERYLEPDSRWRGTGGDYVVTLGPDSHAEKGVDPSLPALAASVNAFTRLWLGVRPATGLAITDDLAGPQSLLETLDRTLRLPTPRPDWDY